VDPYVGTLSDRLQRAPLGRRHTLMAAAILPFAIGLTGVFSPPRTLDQAGLLAWLVGFGLLARVSISFYTVPALAVGAELSRDRDERSVIAMLRNVGNNLATMLVPVLAFQAFFESSSQFPKGQLNPEPYPSFGLTIASVAALCMLIGVIGTRARLRTLELREPPKPEPDRAIRPFAAAVVEFFSAFRITPNILRLMALVFLVLVTLATINQLTLHLSTYLWSLTTSHNQWVLISGQAGTLLGVIGSLRLLKHREQRRVMIWGLVGFFVFALLSVAAPLAGLAPEPGSDAIGIFVSACRFTGGLAYGCYLVPLGALILDIGDEHEVNTGRPQQGLVSAVHFLGLQAASAVVGLIAGLFLQLIAFPAGVPADQMPMEKVNSLGLFVCVVMAVASGLLILVVRTFESSREKQAAIAARLIALRSQGKSSAALSPTSAAQTPQTLAP
jgi:glycoside/pentoside/hexuronide:cation symporter, GPH family